MHLRVSSLFAALILLAACSSTPEDVARSDAGGDAANSGGNGAGAAAARELTDADRAADPDAPDPGSVEDFEVNVGDRVFFALDSSSLDAEAQETLDRQAAWLTQYPDLTVTIEGHADERGTREYNLALGERRAEAAKSYLVARGIESDRILTISYGEERPVDPAHNEDAWAQNRRAVTVVNVVN